MNKLIPVLGLLASLNALSGMAMAATSDQTNEGNASVEKIDAATKKLADRPNDSDVLVEFVTSLKKEKSISLSRDTKHFCHKQAFPSTPVSAMDSLEDYLAARRQHHSALQKCQSSLLAEADLIDGPEKEAYKSAIEAIAKAEKANLTQSVDPERIVIKLDKVEGITLGQKGPGTTIKLSQLARLGVKKEDSNEAQTLPGKKLNFSSIQCPEEIDVNNEDKSDTQKELTRLEAKIDQIRDNETSLPVTCSLKGDLLTIHPKASSRGTTTLSITASYPEGEQTLVSRTFDISVNVSPWASETGPQHCEGWQCQSYYGFFLGAEGTTMDEVKTETILRYEYLSYSQLHDNAHLFGRFYQTSTSELNRKDSADANFDCDAASEEDKQNFCDLEITESINADIGTALFFLKVDAEHNLKQDWGRFSERATDSSLLVGLTGQYGVRKTDEEDRDFVDGAYGGIRFAYSKLRYFDILYGKQANLSGHRVKLKGQLPVFRNNFLVGFEADISADSDLGRKGLSDEDAIKFFVLYQVNFADFIK